MSSFLWVEDFEGGQYREFAYKVFGNALGLTANDFFDNEIELKSFLDSKQIYLATNLAEGIEFINDEANLKKVDFVVLDIDLALMGTDISHDEVLIKPLLERWYNYSTTDANEEQSFNRACDELKRVAGYHLYIDLVVNRRFPRDRVLFCSNHGGYLKAIQESFSGARIEPPTVLTKADPNLNDSVAVFYSDEYAKLRRIIISICDELVGALRFGQAEFALPKYLNNTDKNLKDSDGAYLLSVLPLLLPPYLKGSGDISVIYRQFVRAITQEFDKVNYKDSPHKQKHPYIRVLHSIRNWTSHDSKALNNLSEGDVAFIFSLFVEIGFLTKSKLLEGLESRLFECLGAYVEIDRNELKEKIIVSFEDVAQRGNSLPNELRSDFDQTPHFSQRVNMLIQNACLINGEHRKFIYRIFWHNIVYIDEYGNISQQSIYLDKNKYLNELTRRLYLESF
jgi:hypothetical protein